LTMPAPVGSPAPLNFAHHTETGYRLTGERLRSLAASVAATKFRAGLRPEGGCRPVRAVGAHPAITYCRLHQRRHGRGVRVG
jgi:hypothetical protein